MGEKLGRSEMFLFTALLLQKFKFKKVDPTKKMDFGYIPGTAFHPVDFEIILEERK